MNIRRITVLLFLLIILYVTAAVISNAEERYPSPEFSSSYNIPELSLPEVRSEIFEYLDVFVLLAALILASFFAIKRRSRYSLYILTVFSLLYFGFYRNGCVCPVGSLQNFVLSLSDKEYVLPLSLLFFFSLPLLFSLFFGRVFCSSVCPLGAIQELFIQKPVNINPYIKNIISLIPYLYLGASAVFVVSGTGFIICRLDPFVGIFRLSAPLYMLITGAVFLIAGIFIARPYCRFLCPYGVLLAMFSVFSRRHIRISPEDCINCRLCEDSCPVGAIRKPVPVDKGKADTKHLINIMLVSPFIILLFSWLFPYAAPVITKYNSTVQLADQIKREESGLLDEHSLESNAFRASGRSSASLYAEAATLEKKTRKAMRYFGIFMAVVVIIKLTNLYYITSPEVYEPDRFNCVSCGRCMEYCPVLKNDKTYEYT